MKLHSDVITKQSLQEAAAKARTEHGQDIYVYESITQGSRKRARGITFYAESMHGKRASNRGANNENVRAASWTAYGYLIAELFKQDPKAIIGFYDNPEDFAEKCRQYTPKGESLEFLEILS